MGAPYLQGRKNFDLYWPYAFIFKTLNVVQNTFSASVNRVCKKSRSTAERSSSVWYSDAVLAFTFNDTVMCPMYSFILSYFLGLRIKYELGELAVFNEKYKGHHKLRVYKKWSWLKNHTMFIQKKAWGNSERIQRIRVFPSRYEPKTYRRQRWNAKYNTATFGPYA